MTWHGVQTPYAYSGMCDTRMRGRRASGSGKCMQNATARSTSPLHATNGTTIHRHLSSYRYSVLVWLVMQHRLLLTRHESLLTAYQLPKST